MAKNSFTSLSKKDKMDFYISVVVIALTGTMILAFTFPNDNNIEEQAIYSILNENPMGISEMPLDNVTYKPLEKPFETRELIAEPVKIKQVDAKPISYSSSSVDISSNFETIKEDARSEIVEESKYIQNETIDIVEEEVLVDSSAIKKPNVEVNQKETLDVEESESSEISLPSKSNDDSKSCVIIVGAFKKTNNKEKLLNSLKSDGYTTFTTPYKGLTRIGIYQPCNSNSISITLRSVRKKYAKDAMILVAE